MFGFLTSGTKEIVDPLVVSPRGRRMAARSCRRSTSSAASSTSCGAFDAMRQSRKPIDLARVQAHRSSSTPRSARIAASSSSNTSRTPTARTQLAERIWQAAFDLSQGFISAYQAALGGGAGASRQSALEAARAAALRAAHPLLRHRRQAPRVPLRALDSREVGGAAPLYMRAAELGLDRVATRARRTARNTTQWTVEQEYVYVLLIHQLNTGNMSPAELDWANAQLRGWSRRLSARRRAALAGRLLRRRRAASAASSAAPATIPGSMLRYLDTTPLAEQLDRAIAALRQAEDTDQGPAASDQPAARRRSSKRCARRSRPISTPTCAAIRASRARSRRGCASGCRASPTSSRSATTRDSRRTKPAPARADRGLRGRRRSRRVKRRVRDEHDSLAASACRRSPIRCGRSRTAASRACASRAIGRHRPEPGARRARRRAPVGRLGLGAGRRAPPEQGLAPTRSRPACRSSPTASCRSRCTRSARRRTTWASSSTASTSRRWARASRRSTCRRRRGRTSR